MHLSQETRLKLEELRHELHNLESQGVSGSIQLALARLEELEGCVEADQEHNRRYVSHVNHELRVPMTSILGYTDLLRKGIVGPVNEQQLEFLTVIRNNVERMAILISDLSDLSKAEAGSLRLEIGEVSPKSVIEEVVRNLQPLFTEKNQVFEIEVPGDLPRVYADPRRLAQVLARLLTNASRYTSKAGRIVLHVSRQPSALRFAVVDTGIGISPEDQACLFRQFFRSEQDYVREQPGWGLSLSVVKVFVELMSGSIGVSSTLEKGSEFWFTLPVSPNDPGS
jgi:signal transduction histidine kinase